MLRRNKVSRVRGEYVSARRRSLIEVDEGGARIGPEFNAEGRCSILHWLRSLALLGQPRGAASAVREIESDRLGY
jgi:hypothetical protein